jgi:PhzF family phenazine biosynthesis protein
VQNLRGFQKNRNDPLRKGEFVMKIFHVDAFTSQPFGGNPAGVCILPHPKVDAWMQNVAADMNLSETAFLMRAADGYSLRWFTPKAEVDLCGHGTLASAHILWQEGLVRDDEKITFHTRSGVLTCVKDGEWIGLDFPATPDNEAVLPEGIAEALGAAPLYVGASLSDYLIEVDSEETLRKLAPDYARILELPVRGVIVTSRATTEGFDFVSRFFAPAVGVNEDPVTGSSHCCLGPFWGKRLAKEDLVACQVSWRGGVIKVHLAGDRVHLFGQAVTVMRGELAV